ncbi:hypothetical protein D3C87_1380050 [compost metagenome]
MLSHLVEPVDIGCLAERILHRHLALPLRVGQFPDIGNGAFVEKLGIVGPDIGAGHDGQRILIFRRNIASEIRRQPAFDKAHWNKLCHRRRGIADDRDVTLNIVGPRLADDHLQLRCCLYLRTLRAHAILLGEILRHFHDLACAVIDGDRLFLFGSLDRGVEVERLPRLRHAAKRCQNCRCTQETAKAARHFPLHTAPPSASDCQSFRRCQL